MPRPDISKISVVSASDGSQGTDYSNLSLPELDSKLSEIRMKKNIEINEARLKANESYFVHKGKKIDVAGLSMKDIVGANNEIMNRNALPQMWPGGWKAMDNTFIPITTVDQWKDFHSAMYEQGVRNFMKAQYLKQLLTTVDTIPALLDISWMKTTTPFDDPTS